MEFCLEGWRFPDFGKAMEMVNYKKRELWDGVALERVSIGHSTHAVWYLSSG